MSFWSTADARDRLLIVIGIINGLSAGRDFYRRGAGDLRWVEGFALTVALIAAVPLGDLSRKGVPLQRQLRSPNGLVAGIALGVSAAMFLWRLIQS